MALQPSNTQGRFYLGGSYDLETASLGEDAIHYNSKDLVTHGVCIGMTGSGKTGLCVALLEECALSGIPAILIDPKGDLTNLELTFPELSAEKFQPWINEDEARRRGITPEEFAAKEAETWRQGLAQWGLGPEDIQKFRDKVDLRIFTPGSNAGSPLSILHSFDPPADSVLQDDELRREQIAGVVSALLGLVDKTNAGMQSREHILLATILEQRWLAKENTDLAAIIHLIQTPPFQIIGALSVETFFPAKDRSKLALELNTLLASPSFQNWMTGEPLDIATLLRAPDGRPRLSICYIAHLNEEERMFFVALLLNKVIAWMRSQSGTGGLRALLYFDEIFGYLPPHPKDPPTKRLVMTLLKQGRAFGVGTMLVTQNPVDLDYKALSNCGTWLIGRLQTEQDKARILDGLQGAMDQAGNVTDRKTLDQILSKLGKRVFLLHNVHSGKPQVFHSRWAMSYLAGPLTRDQLKQLVVREQASAEISNPAAKASFQDYLDNDPATTVAPAIPPGLSLRFLPEAGGVFAASLFAQAEILFKDSRSGRTLVTQHLLVIPGDAPEPDWDHAEVLPQDIELVSAAPAEARYTALPALCADPVLLKKLGSTIDDHLMETGGLEIFECAGLKEKSELGESREEFEKRINEMAQQALEKEKAKLEDATEKKLATLALRLEKEKGELERNRERVSVRKKEQTVSTLSSLLEGVLALFSGRKATGARKVGSVLRGATSKRGITQRAELVVEKSQQNVTMLESQIEAMETQLKEDLGALETRVLNDAKSITETRVLPMKSGISIKEFGVLWRG